MRKDRILIAAVITLVALAAGAYLYNRDQYVFLFFGDASSHIVRARQFVDSQIPGLHNLGTVWLPLPHLLMLPFTLIDFLFFSGTAGLAIGIPALVGAALFLYQIIKETTGSRLIAVSGAMVFSLNPNLLYLALTPMSEALLLLFMAMAAFSLMRWLRDGRDAWLLATVAASALATLCRYETWFLPAFLCAIVLWRAIRMRIPLSEAIRQGSLALLSWSGIIFWLVWNQLEYGNAFTFARLTYNAGSEVMRTALAYSPGGVFSIYGKTALYVFGPALMVLFVLGLRGMYRQRQTFFIALLMALPVVFTLIAIILGYVQMDAWWWNSRYVIPLGLPLVYGAAIGLAQLKVSYRAVLITACCAFPLVQLSVPTLGVVIFKDATKSFYDSTLDATRTGEALAVRYTGGTVALLTSSSQGQRIMIPSRIPLKEFRIQYGVQDRQLFQPLWLSEKYVVLAKRPRGDAASLASFWLNRWDLLQQHYQILHQNERYVLLLRKDVVVPAAESRER